jgi:hypothetical protein
VAGADGAWLLQLQLRWRRRLLEAVLDEPPLVPLLDELKMQGHHVVLQLGDGAFQDGDVGEQLLCVGGEVGHVGESERGAVERVLEDGVQRRLLLQRLLQLLHVLLQLRPAGGRGGGGGGRRRGEAPPRLGRQRQRRHGGARTCTPCHRTRRREEKTKQWRWNGME